MAQRPFNITSILNSFKSFIKEIYPKKLTSKIKNKKDQNNYFRPQISQK